MQNLILSLKSGDWVTVERLRVYSWTLLFFWFCAIATVVLTAQGGLDFLGRPLGTDFVNVWSAGRMVLDGRAIDVYDPSLHHLVQQAAFQAPDLPFYGWHYPPFFLAVAAALAALPYGWALLAWMSATFPLYIGVMRKVAVFPLTALVATAYPAVAINLIHGQNGFANAALLGAGLLLLDRRPVLSGLAFGLLAYKPQFGVLIPLVLMVTGRWTVFGAATVTVLTMVGLSTWGFGVDIWSAFMASTTFTREVVLESGALSWDKLVSVFASLRMMGASVTVAYLGQGLMALCAAAATLWLWRRPVALALKSAGLVTAALLATPYALDYDMVVLGLGLAWMASHGLKHGFLAWEKSALVLVWVTPLVCRIAATALHLPLGVLVMVMFLGLIIRRARHDLSLA